MEGLKSEQLYEETSIASLRWNNVRFKHPMLVGDVVHVEMEFTAKRQRATRPAGIITEAVRLVNQNGITVIDSEHISLIQLRE